MAPSKKKPKKAKVVSFAPGKMVVAKMVRPRNADEVFKVLKTFMTGRARDREKERVYNALCGLRGPDIDLIGKTRSANVVKQATTAVLRHHLLGKFMEFGPDIHEDRQSFVEIRREYGSKHPEGSSHFLNHAKDAFQDAGLIWHQKNSTDDDK